MLPARTFGRRVVRKIDGLLQRVNSQAVAALTPGRTGEIGQDRNVVGGALSRTLQIPQRFVKLQALTEEQGKLWAAWNVSKCENGGFR